ncbi:hypothetical protein GCM10023317_27160 [Actinopolymorpha pittospori]
MLGKDDLVRGRQAVVSGQVAMGIRELLHSGEVSGLMVKPTLPLAESDIGEDEITAAVDAPRSEWLSRGPRTNVLQNVPSETSRAVPSPLRRVP